MKDYELRFYVKGVFPNEIKPQLTNDIKIISELGIKSKKPSITEISITASANTRSDAILVAKEKLSKFLGFCSLTAIVHFPIMITDSHPVKITNLTGKRTTNAHSPFSMFDSSTMVFPKTFHSTILPYFPIISKKGNEYLKIAIEYLRKCWFELDPQIKIFNCMVSLEALFSKSGEKTEIGYKLSNRTATLLARNSKERKKIQEEIRDFYDLRSKMVHGDLIDLEFHDFGDLLVYVREAIVRFMILSTIYSNHKDIIDTIDNAMIDNRIQKKMRRESSLLHNMIIKEATNMTCPVLDNRREK